MYVETQLFLIIYKDFTYTTEPNVHLYVVMLYMTFFFLYMLAVNTVDHGFESGHVKLKTMKLVFVAFPLSTQHSGERVKTGWLGIRRMCPSEETYLPGS